MANEEFIDIEIAYALPERQRIVCLKVAMDSTARQVLLESGIGRELPGVDILHCPIGIFGCEVTDEHVMQSGDRIEIYRSLERDPRSARRERAARDART